MPARDTLTALRTAADGLLFPSESDEPWTAFAWPDATGEPNTEGVRKRGKHKADSPAEERSVDDLFQPLVEEQDWFGDEEKETAAKYQALFDAVKKWLTAPKVIRLGERRVAVYVIGTAREGGWAGLKTIAVET